jgi:Flp pilus assembly protein TadD
MATAADSFEANLGLGIVHATEGDAPAAVPFFEKAAAIRPGEAEVHYNLGLALSQVGESEEAAVAYQQSLEIAPNDAAWLNLGNLYKNSGDLAASADSYAKAIDINPRLALAHCNLGNVRAQTGNRERVI